MKSLIETGVKFMEFYFALASLVLLVSLVLYFNLKMISLLEKKLKSLGGDAQQIKTAQRADKKRDYKILTMVTPKKKKTKFDF